MEAMNSLLYSYYLCEVALLSRLLYAAQNNGKMSVEKKKEKQRKAPHGQFEPQASASSKKNRQPETNLLVSSLSQVWCKTVVDSYEEIMDLLNIYIKKKNKACDQSSEILI